MKSEAVEDVEMRADFCWLAKEDCPIVILEEPVSESSSVLCNRTFHKPAPPVFPHTGQTRLRRVDTNIASSFPRCCLTPPFCSVLSHNPTTSRSSKRPWMAKECRRGSVQEWLHMRGQQGGLFPTRRAPKASTTALLAMTASRRPSCSVPALILLPRAQVGH